MFRTRLAALALAGSLLASAGCSTTGDWMRNRPRLFGNRNGTTVDCPCEDVCEGGHGELASAGPVMGGPALFPDAGVVHPHAAIPTLPAPNAAPGSTPPRIVTVPQATPVPSGP